MGKRKSAAKPAPRRGQEKLATEFTCPLCNHGESVVCSMDRKDQIGAVYCVICMEKFSTHVDSLSAPIDVYSEWIDECEDVNDAADDHEIPASASPKQTRGKYRYSRA